MSHAIAVKARLPESLILPTCEPGIGRLITDPASEHLIQGVRLQSVALWPDDRGYFLEVLRVGKGLPADFAPSTTQVSAALSYPGTIKAFHYHQEQTDLWSPALGMLQIALVDLRPQSPTCGAKNTIYAGVLRPWQVLIPPGVAHGYKVIGADAAMLVYATDRFYNPKDEGRIAYNDPQIAYDWETQHK
ncbi:MAG: dTDP-4-dehydrorhamnose 3,5-epimerase family protein [Acidobacteria bacterium]|nr:dTDP-4-dehydrorhamnose 3,5-epimerase family protein [Acidobacteriota bacterium]